MKTYFYPSNTIGACNTNKFTKCFLGMLFFSTTFSYGQTCTYTVPTDATTISVPSGQVYCINQNMPNTLEFNMNGGTLKIASGVNVAKAVLSTANSNMNGIIENNGTITFNNSSDIGSKGGMIIINNRTGATFSAQKVVTDNGMQMTINNDQGATFQTVSQIKLSNNSVLTNYGTVIISTNAQGFQTENGANIYNYGKIEIRGPIEFNATVQNEGWISASGKLQFNGSANVVNNCRMQSAQNGSQVIIAGAASLQNNGLIYAPNGEIVNQVNGTGWINGVNGIARANQFTNNVNFTGSGSVYINTGFQNAPNGTFTGTSSTDSLKVYAVNGIPNNPQYNNKFVNSAKPVSSMYAYTIEDNFYGSCLNQTFQPVALPISLLSFNGKQENDAILLNWQTASEINAQSFGIEKSTDNGKKWGAIGNVPAVGNSSTVQKYFFTDANLADNNLYRLVQYDTDGTAHIIYQYVHISLDNISKAILKIYPNPVRNRATIALSAPQNHDVLFYITDLNGTIKKSVTIASGATATALSTAGLPKGIYILSSAGKGYKTAPVKFIVE